MQPFQVPIAHRFAEPFNLQPLQLLSLDQCDNDSGIPRRHGIEVQTEITRPGPAQPPALGFAWAQG